MKPSFALLLLIPLCLTSACGIKRPLELPGHEKRKVHLETQPDTQLPKEPQEKSN